MDASSIASSAAAHNNDDASSCVMDSVASSAFSNFSNWSSALAGKLSWLRTSSDHNNCNDALSIASSVFREKQGDLRLCLNGKDEQVNLWELREYALTRGGLLSTATRRRAWPKLMGIHQDVLRQAALLSGTSNKKQHLEVSARDLKQLEQDLRERVEWNIENQVHMARKQQAQDDAMEDMQQYEVSSTKRVTFASTPPKLQGCNSEESSDTPPVSSITTMSTSPNDEQPPSSPGTLATLDEQDELTTPMSASLPKKKKIKIALSPHEQAILRNLVVSVLRTPPPLEKESSSANQDGYSYYSGLHNLAALLLINLESPSLTSLILNKLACFHLHDAMMDAASLNQVVQVSFCSLLHELDQDLYDHVIVQSKVIDLSFVTSWVKTWFIQDVNEDLRLASRLVDVCLASHALMPIYMAVAVMTLPENREAILSTSFDDAKSMVGMLQDLPMNMDHLDDPAEAWEDVIDTAVSYIRQIPPPDLKELILVQEATNGLQIKHLLSTTAMLNAPPSWAISSKAPTDWALLQQAKQLRMKSKTNTFLPAILRQQQDGGKGDEATKEDDNEASDDSSCVGDIKAIQESFPSAAVASGLGVSNKSKRTFSLRFIIGLLAVLVFVIVFVSLSIGRAGSSQSVVQETATHIVTNTKVERKIPTKKREPPVVKPKPEAKKTMKKEMGNKDESKTKKAEPSLQTEKEEIKPADAKCQASAVAVKPSSALQVKKPAVVKKQKLPEKKKEEVKVDSTPPKKKAPVPFVSAVISKTVDPVKVDPPPPAREPTVPFVSRVMAKAVDSVTVDPTPPAKEPSVPFVSMVFPPMDETKNAQVDTKSTQGIIPSLMSKLGHGVRKIRLVFTKNRDETGTSHNKSLFGKLASFLGRAKSKETKQ